MCRRYTPLEEWEWIAIHKHRELFEPTMLILLTDLYRAQCLARRNGFAGFTNHGTIWANGTDREAWNGPSHPVSAARIEHRLYTLFAE